MEPTSMRIVKTGKPDLRALFTILSLEGVDVLFQYLLSAELRSYCLF